MLVQIVFSKNKDTCHQELNILVVPAGNYTFASKHRHCSTWRFQVCHIKHKPFNQEIVKTKIAKQHYGAHDINIKKCSTLSDEAQLHRLGFSGKYCDKIGLNFEKLICNIISVQFFNSFQTFTSLKSNSFGWK